MHPQTDPVKRGVYALPHLSKRGHRMLVAVDSQCREVTRALVFRRESETCIASMLERVLDKLDPVAA